MTLTASSVSFGFGRGADVLRELTFTVRPGEVFVVVGPNASGKTTLLRLLLGVERARSGRVELEGRSVRSIPARARARSLAFVAQRPTVAADFTVREVVRLGRHALRADEGAVERALERLELSGLAGVAHHELSAGQQQRVAIARAVAQLDPWGRDGGGGRAAFLLADEPTSAMDPRHALGTVGLLRDLARAGVGVCIALHDLTAARRVADSALALDSSGGAAAVGAGAAVLEVGVLSRVFGVGFQEIESRDGTVLAPLSTPEGRGG